MSDPARNGTASDPAAWIRGVLDRHEGPLLAYARQLLGGDLERARDLVQDVFLRLVREGGAALGDGTTVWLFRVCRNRALDVRAKEEPLRAVDAGEGPPDASAPGPLERLEVLDDAARVRAAVERLPERERELVRLKFEHGLSYREMAEVMDLTATNVGFLLHKALRTLRERLSDAPGRARTGCST